MLEFDEGGIYRLVLNVGHRVVPEGKKRYRWKTTSCLCIDGLRLSQGW